VSCPAPPPSFISYRFNAPLKSQARHLRHFSDESRKCGCVPGKKGKKTRKDRTGGRGCIWGKQENSKITSREDNRQTNGKDTRKAGGNEIGTKKEIKEVRKVNQEVKGEIERLKEEFKNKQKNWEEEKNNMFERVAR
jgi:molecular chaperone GrpE (heat shock protein)